MMEPAATKISANGPTNSAPLFFSQFCSTKILLSTWESHPAEAAGCKVPLVFPKKDCSTSVGGYRDSPRAKADGQGKTPAQVRVHLSPEVDGALQDQRLDTAHGAGDIADQVVAVGL